MLRRIYNMKCDKMILAVLQGDDYPEIVSDLNEHGIYLTMLNSSGGFLRKKSVTVMIGVEAAQLDTVLDILKTHAGSRMEMEYVPSTSGPVGIPVQVKKGGIAVFIMNVERCEKY